MAEFKREHDRYIVLKIKDMTPVQRVALQCHLENHATPTLECVVVEPDWPIYEETWENVQRLVEGRPSIGENRDALAAHVDGIRAAYAKDCPMALACALNADPETGLSRLKAEWQAEALEDAQASLMLRGDDREALRLMIETTRRQA